MAMILKINLFILFFILSNLYSRCDDYRILLNQFLKIKNNEFYKSGSDGNLYYDELQEYKQQEKLYIKYQNILSNDTSCDNNSIKIFLFIGFSAYHNKSAATREAYISDFFPIFQIHKLKILRILNDLPILLPSTCHYLNRYFGFEDKNTHSKAPFLNKIEKEVNMFLSKENAKLFLQYIRK